MFHVNKSTHCDKDSVTPLNQIGNRFFSLENCLTRYCLMPDKQIDQWKLIVYEFTNVSLGTYYLLTPIRSSHFRLFQTFFQLDMHWTYFCSFSVFLPSSHHCSIAFCKSCAHWAITIHWKSSERFKSNMVFWFLFNDSNHTKVYEKTQRSKSHVNRHCNCVSKLSPLEQAKIARIGIKLSTLSALQEQCCPFCFYQ